MDEKIYDDPVYHHLIECPFCSDNPSYGVKFIKDERYFNVVCYGCSAKIGFFKNTEEASFVWNTRNKRNAKGE